MTSPGRSARDAILETAERLFYANGYRAVGVDRVIAESGVAKATFYRHFPAKDDLLLAVLDGRDGRMRAALERRVLAIAPRPADRPLAVFEVLAEWMREPEYRGCAFLNSMVEIADPTHPVHVAAHRHKSKLAELFTRFLADAGAVRAEEVGLQLVLLLDGAIVTSVHEGGSDAAARARTIAKTLIESSAPQKRRSRRKS